MYCNVYYFPTHKTDGSKIYSLSVKLTHIECVEQILSKHKHTVQEDGLIDRSKPQVTAEICTRHVVVKVNGTVEGDHIRHNDLYIVLPHVKFFLWPTPIQRFLWISNNVDQSPGLAEQWNVRGNA